MLRSSSGWLVQSTQDACEKRFFAVLDACDKPAWVDEERLALVFASEIEASSWADIQFQPDEWTVVEAPQ